ncbi:MAG TPA: hypothetical protein VIZ28_19975 [Chitinophagaceae bacterium]
MPANMPSYIAILFALTTVVTLLILFAAIRQSSNSKNKSILILIALVVWLILQAALSYNNFYENNFTTPPKLMLVVLPPALTIVFLFISKKGRQFIDGLPLQTLTWLNIVRVPVEIGLYYLAVYKTIPQLMTFEGRNFDIIAGITAPLIAWFGFIKRKLPKKVILGWNIICLLLVLNILTNGILSVPTRFQQFAFDQPNIAVLYFPYIWLPAFIVPAVIFTHLVSIRQLTTTVKK